MPRKSSVEAFVKFNLFLCSLITLCSLDLAASVNVHNPIKIIPKVIYGIDNREEIFESSDSLMRELAKSTAAKMQNDSLVTDESNPNLVVEKSETLKDWQRLCSSERFINQPTAATCSGFLVAPDVLVTAGHCIYNVSECENHSWVFDYANTSEEKAAFTFNKNQIYHCTQIIAREKNTDDMNDYAVLKLDRPVTGRVPLKYRTDGKISDDAVLTVIGNPSGLPTKITSGAEIRNNSNPIFFTTNSDTYGRNSGSAVINSKTGVVEGILVRGDVDFTQSKTDTCNVSIHHDQTDGKGEDVTRITNIKALLKR